MACVCVQRPGWQSCRGTNFLSVPLDQANSILQGHDHCPKPGSGGIRLHVDVTMYALPGRQHLQVRCRICARQKCDGTLYGGRGISRQTRNRCESQPGRSGDEHIQRTIQEHSRQLVGAHLIMMVPPLACFPWIAAALIATVISYFLVWED